MSPSSGSTSSTISVIEGCPNCRLETYAVSLEPWDSIPRLSAITGQLCDEHLRMLNETDWSAVTSLPSPSHHG